MEFHISSSARDKYEFDQVIFAKRGNVIFSNYHAAQKFAEKIKSVRQSEGQDTENVSSGDLFAMGLLDEIYHFLLEKYRKEVYPAAYDEGFVFLGERITSPNVDLTLEKFNTYFAPLQVYTGQVTTKEYLELSENGMSNRHSSLEEMIVLWLENHNPALEPYAELFDDTQLSAESHYAEAQAGLYWFFEKSPKFGQKNLNLIDFLLEPARTHPYSLTDQLNFIQEEWGSVIGDLLDQVLRSIDFFAEEATHFTFFSPHPVETLVPDYQDKELYGTSGEADIVKFAIDKEWMPKLVLIAKNAYVWLDQLSKQYGYEIKYLGDIPDAELDRLRWMGITGLWLIGLWERSTASARIKQLCGNPDALASAYSLSSYHVAADLGGDAAYQNLYHRAMQRGIRLGSDMVPNHMGIDSPWVVEYPDWFIQLSYPPFPGYTFSGPDLSVDDRVEVFLEDHYYEKTDASVVFLMKEKNTGRHRYIYHGNDGTSMPWNDTAQLNYLISEVREAVIQTIIEVAKKFPVVRFDAAMTLTKKHFQRLWYPEPGSGGDIPSRAEYGLTKKAFDEIMPVEFWQEVVDRVAQEAPDTLLLAEAFWFMEGYFVRSLGMHRVYNSAFMNMLRDEENAKYRDLIRKTLEFEPEILQRYVNFMNNPDEDTAIDQFGDGDKYFGVCTMMATLPGLPMFGHGQVEGYHEKYGMEYKKAYWDEIQDQYLFERHARQIFPLLHHRELFSYVENFHLYDFETEHGVDENVFAYSNRFGDMRGLVVYQNAFAETTGRIKNAIPTKDAGSGELITSALADGLAIPDESGLYCLMRDQVSGLHYIFSTEDFHKNGLQLHLHAYQCHVFVDFENVRDSESQPYGKLCEILQGRGVPDIQQAFVSMKLEPVHIPLREILHAGYLKYLLDVLDKKVSTIEKEGLLKDGVRKVSNLLDGVIFYKKIEVDQRDLKRILEQFSSALTAFLSDPRVQPIEAIPGSTVFKKAEQFLLDGVDLHPENRIAFIITSHLYAVKQLLDECGLEDEGMDFLQTWHIDLMIVEVLQSMGINYDRAVMLNNAVQLILTSGDWYQRLAKLNMKALMSELFSQLALKRFIQINTYDDIEWFNEELLRDLEWWLVAMAYYYAVSTPAKNAVSAHEALIGSYEVALELREARLKADYQFGNLLRYFSVEIDETEK